MKPVTERPSGADRSRILFAFGRLQFPRLQIADRVLEGHLARTFAIYAAKEGALASWPAYWHQLYPLDWYLACGCLEQNGIAWQHLFELRVNLADGLLVDALRLRAARLFPQNEERQETAVTEFWSRLLVSEPSGRGAILGRFDGLRPLAPWLIRVFQNWHISELRRQTDETGYSEDEWPMPARQEDDEIWRHAFQDAARAWLASTDEQEQLILGLRWRYRMSQREAAGVLGVHEGTLSRQTSQLRDQCLDFIEKRLTELGWTDATLNDLVASEMGSILTEDPRLSADCLARLIANRKLRMPENLT